MGMTARERVHYKQDRRQTTWKHAHLAYRQLLSPTGHRDTVTLERDGGGFVQLHMADGDRD